MLGWMRRQWTRPARKARERFPALFATDALDGDLVALDTETTGLDPKRAEIVAIGAVRIRGNRLLTSQGFSAVVKPTRRIDPASIRVHQIRPVDVQRAGLDIATAMERLVAFVGPRPLVGYYLEFDVAVIERTLRELAGASIRLPNERIEVSALYYDTVLRKRQSLRLYGQADLRMDTIRRDLGLPAFPQHDAISDAVMAGLMYLKLRRIAEGGDNATSPRPTERIPLSPRGRGPG
jgi:DNA polymerase-3 subunit epsilon